MGYRAHIIKQHRDYGSYAFYDFSEFEEYFEYLRSSYPDDELFEAENEDYFEIPKEIIEAEIKRISKLKPEQIFYSSKERTNKDMVDALERMLKESPADSEYVSLEWF